MFELPHTKQQFTFSILLILSISYVLLNHTFLHAANNSTQQSSSNASPMNFFIVLCYDASKEDGLDTIKENEVSMSQLIVQASTMIKTAVALTSGSLRFYVITDEGKLFDTLSRMINSWPWPHRRKLTLIHKTIKYPKEFPDLKTIYKMCTTARIFVPLTVQDVSEGIYLDTDTLFMRPPEDLYSFFKRFDDIQLAGLTPRVHGMIYQTNEIHQVPFYGFSGVNGGVFLMNLTRLKDFPGLGWVNENIKAYQDYKEILQSGDQDILNAVFAQFPEFLYVLPCSWNFRHTNCLLKKNFCFDAQHHGINILHGIGGAFFSKSENKRVKEQAVFRNWVNYKLGDSLQELVLKMETDLKNVHAFPPLTHDCSNVYNIEYSLVKSLKAHVFK